MKLYVVICIPKSGSSSLVTMVERSLASGSHFRIPQLDIYKKSNLHPAEIFLQRRRILRGLIKYRVINEKMFWKKISKIANDGDMISGHMPYGQPQLSGWDLNYITLLRNPIDRIISEYYYTRQGYLSRPRYRQIYHKGHSEVTGTKSFSEFLKYLYANKDRYNNPAVRFVTGTSNHKDPFAFLKKNYFHFGILERMDLFTNQLAEKLDTRPEKVWENKTLIKEPYQPTESDLELIHMLFNQDISFYNSTKEFILNTI